MSLIKRKMKSFLTLTEFLMQISINRNEHVFRTRHENSGVTYKRSFSHFIFAKRILFCEGDSDFLFLTALKEFIMKRSQGIQQVLQLIHERNVT